MGNRSAALARSSRNLSNSGGRAEGGRGGLGGQSTPSNTGHNQEEVGLGARKGGWGRAGGSTFTGDALGLLGIVALGKQEEAEVSGAEVMARAALRRTVGVQPWLRPRPALHLALAS